MDNFNGVDYFFLGIFLFSILAGFTRGLLKEIISLLSLFAAIIVGATFSSALAASFTSNAGVQTVVSQASSSINMDVSAPVSYVAIAIAFGVLFAGTLIIGSIVGFLLNLVVSFGILGLGNRILGALFGFGRGFLINLVLIFMIQLTAVGALPGWGGSQIVQGYQPYVTWLGGIVIPGFAGLKEKAQQSLQGAGDRLKAAIPN